jgi:hypothetical protein
MGLWSSEWWQGGLSIGGWVCCKEACLTVFIGCHCSVKPLPPPLSFVPFLLFHSSMWTAGGLNPKPYTILFWSTSLVWFRWSILPKWILLLKFWTFHEAFHQAHWWCMWRKNCVMDLRVGLLVLTASWNACPLACCLLTITRCGFVLQETMSKEHAIWSLFIGSAVLLSLFLPFKFLPQDLINTVFSLYFFVPSVLAVLYIYCTFASLIFCFYIFRIDKVDLLNVC